MVAFSSPLVPGVLCVLINILLISSSLATAGKTEIPTVIVKNGTLNGRYLEGTWDQDLFLGIPFAQPPIGARRFKWPQGLNESISTPQDASAYGYSCMQYGSNFNISEDCLTLNGIYSSSYTNRD
jgi:carboxylesterase type B